MNKIQLAFKQAMTNIAGQLKLAPLKLNLWIKFNREGVAQLIVRNDDKNVGAIQIENLITSQMIAARLYPEKIVHFFRTIHAAYMIGSKIENPAAVSLVLYRSKTVQEVCIGIYENEIAKRAFRLTEVIKLTELGRAEQN